ncbi:MAG: enoyl-CoA hydratase/isomerase family protein, partial [Pseudomonadota bacterium]|nr:enoyl-CoA hydratase/isomerase family protein [Pseudomonadota bacterium]
MSTEPVLLQSTQGHVRLLTLNRPEKKNSLSGELTRSLVAAIDEASADPAVRTIGITGKGDTFCAGADLSPGQERESPDATIERVVKLVTGI